MHTINQHNAPLFWTITTKTNAAMADNDGPSSDAVAGASTAAFRHAVGPVDLNHGHYSHPLIISHGFSLDDSITSQIPRRGDEPVASLIHIAVAVLVV